MGCSNFFDTPPPPPFQIGNHILFSAHQDLPMTREESGLGLMEYSAIEAAYQEKKPAKKRVKFTEEERFQIGKYAAVHGATKAVKHFKKTHSHFGKSTARKLRDRYNEMTKHNIAACNKMPRLKRGRSLMLGNTG